MRGPILLQGAMDVETGLLIDALEGRQELTVGGCRFWTGRIGERQAVVSRTGIGPVEAACATTLGVGRFRPEIVINQGIAGSHREDLHVGDLVVAADCVAIHDIKTPRRGRGEGSDPSAWQLRDFAADRDDEPPRPLPADPAWAARLMAAPYAGGQKRLGRLGSGGVFDREHDRILWLRERLGEDCEDMESYAAFLVCRRMGVPCAGVRIISNNELTGEAYRRETGETLQRFILDAVR